MEFKNSWKKNNVHCQRSKHFQFFFLKAKIESNRIKERAPESVPNPHNHFEFDSVVYLESDIVNGHVTHHALSFGTHAPVFCTKGLLSYCCCQGWWALGRAAPWTMATCVNSRHWDEKIFCFLSWEPAEVWHLSQFCVYPLTASQGRFTRWERGLR